MKYSLNKYYPFKVWAVTLICGPFLAIGLNFIRRPDSIELGYLFGAPPILALGGAFVSLPAFGIYYFAYRILRLKIRSDVYLKLILCSLSVFCSIAIIYFFENGVWLQPTNRDGFLFTCSYLICTVTAGIYFRINKQENPPVEFSFENQV